eukprot:3362590-Prorocentrum_lima.AAC.1
MTRRTPDPWNNVDPETRVHTEKEKGGASKVAAKMAPTIQPRHRSMPPVPDSAVSLPLPTPRA